MFMKAALFVLVLGAGLVACSKPAPPSRAQRVTLIQKNGSSFELVPADGLPPHCHVFAVTATGYVQLHTATEDQLSLDCPAGAPITGRALRVPKREGKVSMYVIFSDRRIESAPLSMQIQEMVSQQKPVTAVDLRAPGRVVVEMAEFTPSE